MLTLCFDFQSRTEGPLDQKRIVETGFWSTVETYRESIERCRSVSKLGQEGPRHSITYQNVVKHSQNIPQAKIYLQQKFTFIYLTVGHLGGGGGIVRLIQNLT